MVWHESAVFDATRNTSVLLTFCSRCIVEHTPEQTLGRRGPIAFVKLLEDWRAEGTLQGLELR